MNPSREIERLRQAVIDAAKKWRFAMAVGTDIEHSKAIHELEVAVRFVLNQESLTNTEGN